MRIYEDISLKNFKFWSGAATGLSEELTDEQFDTLEAILEDMYPDGMEDSQVNDLFWFEEDWIREVLGMESADGFPKYVKITGPLQNSAIVKVSGETDIEDLERIDKCTVEEMEDVDVDDREAIDYADFDEESFIWDEDNMWDQYEIPEYAVCAIEYGDFSGLEEEDADNIQLFVNELQNNIPEGYTIVWEEDSHFESFPEFGLACNCVTARVYPIKKH